MWVGSKAGLNGDLLLITFNVGAKEFEVGRRDRGSFDRRGGPWDCCCSCR
jgi:hypothetical protein